jgi:Zn-dependent protease with chaperone function
MLLLAPIAAMSVQMAISRARKYAADKISDIGSDFGKPVGSLPQH